MIRVLLIVGTRPEIIKMAPVFYALQRDDCFEPVLVSTGQHDDLSHQALETFRLEPAVDLALMRSNQSPAEVMASILDRFPALLRELKPDLILIQGDTTTAAAVAFASFLERLPLGHVEAGLRTYDIYQPFPEEVNRRVCSATASLHFAPTRLAAEALQAERPHGRIVITGNTAIDALFWALDEYGADPGGEERDWKPYILLTCHRRENFGPGVRAVCSAVRVVLKEFPELHVVYPVHPNPHIAGPVHEALGTLERVHLLEPTSYPQFARLMANAHLIWTDSGGVQEEAPSLSKPVLVLRNKTERPEGVTAGAVRLVGTDPGTIVTETRRLLADPAAYAQMSQVRNPYGDGRAARRIVETLREHFALPRPDEVLGEWAAIA